MKRMTEFYCHDCDGYIRVRLDMSLNGNHVVKCPKCGHEHCRVIKNGKVTGDRWDSRNGQTYHIQASSSSYYTTSMYATASSSTAFFLMDSWGNTTNNTGYYTT